MAHFNRRMFLCGAGVLAASAMGGKISQASPQVLALSAGPATPMPIFKTLKWDMVQGDAPMVEKFRMLKRLGYHGIELNSPNEFDTDEVKRAIDEAQFPVCGVVNSVHWRIRLSDADPQVREQARTALEEAVRDVHAYGGSSVLLVPGTVGGADETHDHVWQRSIVEIRKVLPLCANLGIHILIENVWNKFLYVEDGPDDQTAEQLAAYVDEINSPWVGVHFDIGNHTRYGSPAQWIRTLGRRIVKLDVKDYDVAVGREDKWAGFAVKIGDGSVDWPAVRQALTEIGYTGWASAEVSGGDETHLADVLARMNDALGPA